MRPDRDVTLIAARHGAALVPVLCGVAAFGLYLATLAPTVGAGDSAELALAAGRGGIPHPPGYPLWVMAAWLFVHAPGLSLLGDLGWRTNLFSAVATALAVAGTAALALRLGRSPVAAALAAALVALAPTVWAQATIAEVHGLHLLLIVLWSLGALKVTARPDRPGATGLGAATTLLLTFHPLDLALLPLALAAGVKVVRRDRTLLPALCLGGALGLLPQLWTPLRALGEPGLDAFGAARPDRLLAGWSREIYGPLRDPAPPTFSRIAAQLSTAGTGMIAVLGTAGLGLTLLGVSPFLRRRRALAGLVGGTALLSLAGPWLLLNAEPDAARRLSIEPAQVAVWLIAALVTARGFDRLRALVRAGSVDDAPDARRREALAAALALVAIVTLHGVPQLERQDRSNDRIARWYGEDLLRPLAPGATLFLEGDNELFLTAYLQHAEQIRPDVRLVHRRGYLVTDPLGWRGRPRDVVTRDRDAREADFVRCADAPIYFAARPEWAAGGEFALRREGLAWRVTTTTRALADRTPAPDLWPALHAEAWGVAPETLDFLHRKCLVGYYHALADWLTAVGDAEAARAAWGQAARIGFDFPETPALLAALADVEARP